MTNNELVNYYYDKFKGYMEKRKGSFSDFDGALEYLKDYLEKIINQKRDYIFTEPVIEYLSYSDASLLPALENLSGDNIEKYFGELSLFFATPIASCFNFDGDINSSNNDYVLHLDDDTKKAVVSAYRCMNSVKEKYHISDEDDFILFRLLLAMLAKYYFLEQKITEFPAMIDRLSLNPLYILEDLKLSGISKNNISEFEKFAADRVYEIIEEKSKAPIIS